MHLSRGVLFVPFLLMTACSDGGTEPPDGEAADIRLEASGVTWEAGELTATITARVLDAEGAPVAGATIGLEADRSSPTISPDSGTSDASGEVVFQASTTRGEAVRFQGQLTAGEQELGDPVEVAFGLTLTLEASEVTATFPGAQATLTATVADDQGPVEGAEVELQARRDDDTLTPDRQATDDAGQAVFELTTQATGEADVGLVVAGLDLEDTPITTVTIAGLSITAAWRHEQPDAVLIAPRAGLVWIDKNADLTEELPARELTSVGIDPVPDLSDSGTVTLALPLDPPEGDLYRVDPTNPDLPESFVIASYGLGIYDDLDLSGDLSPADALVAISDADVVLVYARGELPDEAMAPGLVLGYQYLDSLEGDPPRVFPFEELAEKHRMDIRMAPCPSGTMAGQATVNRVVPPGAALRVATVMVDAGLFLAGDLAHLLDHDNYIEIASAPADYVLGDAVSYTLDLPHPSTVNTSYRDLLVSVPGAPALGLMVPILYLDVDDDGAFTNDDDNLATGDVFFGLARGTFGVGQIYLEWVDSPIPPMLSFGFVGLNQGYNVVREPLKARITEVIDDNTLKLGMSITASHHDVSFRIQHPVGLGVEVVMTGDDLSTGMGAEVTSDRGGFLGPVDPTRDVLVFTNEINGIDYGDLDTPVDVETL